MNTKVVYAAGIVILIIGILSYFVNIGVFTSEESIPSSPSPILNDTETGIASSVIPVSSSSPSPSPSNAIGSNYENLTVLAKSLDILPRNDILTAEIALDVYNPNKGAALLETLSYSIYFDNVRLVSADIGAKPEGFVDSLGSVYTIIGNQTITLKDRQPITEEGVSLFNSNGTLILDTNNNVPTTQNSSDSFVINGTFATSLNRGSQTQASEHVFNLQFPLKQ